LSKATVDVVVPVFNAETTLAQTLESVLGQTHRDIALFVVDDGSTDNSPAIASRFATGDSRIRLVRQRNAGVAAARNNGAAQGSAPYLAFCDADDLWRPDKLSRQLQRLEAGGPAMGLVYCGFAQIDAAGRIVFIRWGLEEGKIFARLMRANFMGNGSCPMFRRAAFEALGGFNAAHTPAEDLGIYLEAARHFDVGVVTDPLVGYRQQPDGLSSNGAAVYLATERILFDLLPFEPGLSEDVRAHLAGVLAWQVVRAARCGRWSDAARLLAMRPALLARALGPLGVRLLDNLSSGAPEFRRRLLNLPTRETFTIATGSSQQDAGQASGPQPV
jgi:glycosyltransferase involved in cell wall biosynthesis